MISTHRAVREELYADEEQERRSNLQAEREPPGRVAREERAAVADPVRDNEADSEHLLRQTDDEPANLWWSDLRLREPIPCERGASH